MSEFFPEIPRILTALTEWMACLVYVLILKKKIKGFRLPLFLVGALVIQASFLMATGNLDLFFWVPSMIVAILLMILLIHQTTDVSLYEAGYFGIKAFVAAELVASFHWQVHYYLIREDNVYSLAGMSLLILVYGLSFFLIWFLEKRHMPEEGKLYIKAREFWSTATIGFAVFFISNLSFVSIRTPFSGQYAAEILNIRTLVDLGGFAILFAYHVQINELRVKHELEAMQNIFQNQYTQYQQSKESIELINYKYHDLKNQLIAIKAETDPEKREAYIDDMQSGIKTFEAQHKTGNQVVDTMLTTKHMYCIKNNITLTSVADGHLLDKMDVADICTIFGNALDNAIEYEMKVKDIEKRLIHLTLHEQNNFVLIQIENYYEGNLELADALPHTTKKDKQNHGYGLKSIRHTVQKYDGIVKLNHKNHWFQLTVLIPKLK